MARSPVLAAGGIVLRQGQTPLVAVVRLRKRNEWVLPKGKLDDGETPRAAAEREVLEETGHAVAVHEFLGTLVYESGGRSGKPSSGCRVAMSARFLKMSGRLRLSRRRLPRPHAGRGPSSPHPTGAGRLPPRRRCRASRHRRRRNPIWLLRRSPRMSPR